ncbi:hypothetical protein NEMBOFW57_000099 [Staphylotrichum longicolle]|uniref:FAD-binding domain-containing protein n=1 Tax=Staphylotrichum longicolle TaxID=669026 RepID=A0AAD4HWT5_9PEZI|nr:hypothetical protein NEMBOFW57_000099 [Staphylotrichum longicolle]
MGPPDPQTQKPILIIGAGVSGLLLAQYLRKTGSQVPVQVFERDADLATRGLGWGLTLHWSLPALRSLLPEDLVARLPEAYVDRAAVDEGRPSTFPFYDLSTGELKAKTPTASSHEKYHIPVRLMGVKLDCTPEEIEPLRKLDPFFLQGAASQNDSFVYFSVLDAPSNTPEGNGGKYSCQMVVSWPIRDGFFNQTAPIVFPETSAGGIALIKKFADTWAEPFRSLAHSIPSDTDVKYLELYDWPPPKGLRTTGHVALVGDALHPMAMYRGEGANHAIVDVLDLAELVIPHLLRGTESAHPTAVDLRAALDRYEDRVVGRARPAVLASRQASLDAHQWARINDKSPLLSRRAMNLAFDESDMM